LDILVEHLKQDEQDLAKLRDYTARVTDQVRALAVDEERDRLARELHDGVKQHLFSLSMTASAIRTHLEESPHKSPDLREMAYELETASKTVQRELTRLIENLRPGTLEEKGLASALNDYMLLYGAREHITAYLDVKGNDALLPPSVAETLYRVAQEALHNVARHARATRVDVQLRCLPEQAALTLSDNGVGFDLAQARRGLGLGSMQDRMMSIGGRLTIDSKPGAGTVVRAKVELTHPLNAASGLTRTVKDSPNPSIKNWAWLGQRLVIPVGQTWPWLPADERHLRQPLVVPGEQPICAQSRVNLLGQRRIRFLQRELNGKPWIKIRHRRTGYEWQADGANWALEHIRGPGNTPRAVLLRNGQPLAAVQLQGRLLSTWTEIVYDRRGYCLIQEKALPSVYTLSNQSGEELARIEKGAVLRTHLSRALPLPLLVMVVLQVGAEAQATNPVTESPEAIVQ
jgi:two-component sensor histidine kinase